MMRVLTIIAILFAAPVAGCSSNYGIFKEHDIEHGQYDGVKTYWALAAAALLFGLDVGDD